MTEILALKCEYLEAQSQLVRDFRLNSYDDGTLELVDLKKNRIFLKRVYCNVSRNELFAGSVVNIFGKAIEVMGPADEGTRKYFETKTSIARAAVRICESEALGALVRDLQKSFTCLRTLKSVALCDLPTSTADRLRAAPGELVLILKIFDASGIDGQARLNALLDQRPGVTAVALEDDIDRTLPNIAGRSEVPTATLCLVKPHAYKRSGDVLSAIADAGFKVTGLQVFILDTELAHKFFMPYKGVWPRYEDIVAHMLEGPCLAIQVTTNVSDFRDFAGPTDANLARILRPKSLRARFGIDVVQNAVHCTDMREDAPLECSYFFNFLATGAA